jgi:hypothetical protein
MECKKGSCHHPSVRWDIQTAPDQDDRSKMTSKTALGSLPATQGHVCATGLYLSAEISVAKVNIQW